LDALEPAWLVVKAHYLSTPSMTGGAVYKLAFKATNEGGYEFGEQIAGPLLGSFPHESIQKDKIKL
jgi:hypothetical protein